MKCWKCALLGAAGMGLLVVGGTYLKGRRLIDKHVADYAEHWHAPSPADNAADVLHYVALGDSTAQGVGATSVDKGYVSIIGQRLQAATGRPVAITNLSVSGSVSDGVVVEQLPAFRALPFKPDLVTMEIGANDVVFPRYNVKTFTRSFERIVSELPPGSFISDVPWMVFPGFAQQSEQMTVKARQLIAEHGHRLVPLYDATRAEGMLRYPTRAAKDWFHPNDAAYEAWADVFWATIEGSGVLEELRAADFVTPKGVQ